MILIKNLGSFKNPWPKNFENLESANKYLFLTILGADNPALTHSSKLDDGQSPMISNEMLESKPIMTDFRDLWS